MAIQKWRCNKETRNYGRPALTILAVLILAVIPFVIRSPYYVHLLIVAGMNAVLAMTFIMMLRTGLISLGIAAFWGVGAYASAAIVLKAGLSFWLALPAATVITTAIAWGIGYVVVRNTGFSFIILTTVIGMVAGLVFGNIKWLGGFPGIEYIPPPDQISLPLLPPILFISKTPYYFLMLGLFLAVFLSFRALYTSSTGKAWMAIGLNPGLASSMGVNVFRYRLAAFVVASAAAGLEGSFYAHYIGSINPNAFNIFKTISVQIYAILGGIGFAFWGPIVGALIMTFVPEWLRIAKEVEPILTGFLLLLLVIFLPGGVLSLTAMRRASWKPASGIVRLAEFLKKSSAG